MSPSAEFSCRNPSCSMQWMNSIAHGTPSAGIPSGLCPVYEHPVHGGSRVQLLCSGCGAQVVPCDCCRALLVLWPPAQPKAACQGCGAETAQGDSMRRIVGLPPNSFISAEGAVRIQVQLLGRDAYRGFKVRELQVLREKLQREAHESAALSAAGSSAQQRAADAHSPAAEPQTGSGGDPPGETRDGPAAKRRRAAAVDEGSGEGTGGAGGEGPRNERGATGSSSRRGILTSMARCRWQILLIDEGSGPSARREGPGSGATKAQLPLDSMAGGARSQGAAAPEVVGGPDGGEEAQVVITHAHVRVLRELHRSMAACGCLPDETVPDSEDEEADSGSPQPSLGCSQAQVGGAVERGPALRETEELLDEAGRFLRGRQSLRAKRERALAAQGLVKQAEDDCRQHAELNPGSSGGMGASVLLGMLWKRQQECAAEADAEAGATVGPGSWAATRGRSEIKRTIAFICTRLQELEAAEVAAAAAAAAGPPMPCWGAASTAASPSPWSPGLQQRRRQQLWGDIRSAEDNRAGPAAAASLPSSFQAAVAACLREAEVVLQSCGSGPSNGSPGGPPVVLSSQASGGASVGGGRGRRGGGQQQDPAEDRSCLLTALDLWRRLYRTLATTS